MKNSFKRVFYILSLSLLLSVTSSAFKTTTGLTFMIGSSSEFRLLNALSIHMGYHLDNCNSSEVFVPYSNFGGNSIGLCVEKGQRGDSKYNTASTTCISLGKRLMDYKEWRFACDGKTIGDQGTQRSGLGASMANSGNSEWANSRPKAIANTFGLLGMASITAGNGSCSKVSYSLGRASNTSGNRENNARFRCVR